MKPPTRAPFYATLYPGLCDIARARGYALAIHGTVTSDLDLIACPWTEEAVSAEELRDALMQHIGALDYEGITRRQFPDNEELVQQILKNERARKKEPHDETGACLKPHGRRSWNLYLDHGCRVDLSIMPKNDGLDAMRKERDEWREHHVKLLARGKVMLRDVLLFRSTLEAVESATELHARCGRIYDLVCACLRPRK